MPNVTGASSSTLGMPNRLWRGLHCRLLSRIEKSLHTLEEEWREGQGRNPRGGPCPLNAELFMECGWLSREGDSQIGF